MARLTCRVSRLTIGRQKRLWFLWKYLIPTFPKYPKWYLCRREGRACQEAVASDSLSKEMYALVEVCPVVMLSTGLLNARARRKASASDPARSR
jgi:hypothetical protein